MNLNQKIIELRKLVKVLKKEAQGNNHKYVSEDQILLAIGDKMDALGLLLEPQVNNDSIHSYPHTYINSKGKEKKEIIVSGDMIYTWTDAESSESKEIQWTLMGQHNDAAQSMGAALTYANRYFLLKYFQVSTSEQDPDRLALQKLKSTQQDYEVFANITIKYDEAIVIVKTAIKELCNRLGVRIADLDHKFKERVWCGLSQANLDQLFKLEAHLRTLNNPEHEWHKLYNTKERNKNLVPVSQQIDYLRSQTVFGKIAMENAASRDIQLDIIEFYETGGIDLNKYLGDD